MKKRLLSLLCLSLVVVMLLTSCGNTTPTETPTPTPTATVTATPGIYLNGTMLDSTQLIVIDGVDVPFEEFRYYYLNLKYQKDQGDNSYWETQGAHSELLAEVEDYILSTYAVKALVKQYDVKLSDKYTKLLDDQIKAAVDECGGEEEYVKALADIYTTPEAYRELLELGYLQDSLFIDMFGDDIYADTIKNYYRAKHIMVSYDDEEDTSKEKNEEAYKLITEVYSKLKDGGDFDTLMEEYCEDYGMVSFPDGYYFTTGDMPETFYNTVTALKENETSEIFETEHGYHIALRLPLDEEYVRENILTFMSMDIYYQIEDIIKTAQDNLKVAYSEAYNKLTYDSIK